MTAAGSAMTNTGLLLWALGLSTILLALLSVLYSVFLSADSGLKGLTLIGEYGSS